MEYPLARRRIRAATYRLAFCRAMVALAKIFSREEADRGVEISMTRALEIIREEKTRGNTRLVEPTRGVLLREVEGLHHRVEELKDEQSAMGAKLQAGLENHVHALRHEIAEKLDLLLTASGVAVGPAAFTAAAIGPAPFTSGGAAPACACYAASASSSEPRPPPPANRSRSTGRGRSGDGERPPTRRKQRIGASASARSPPEALEHLAA